MVTLLLLLLLLWMSSFMLKLALPVLPLLLLPLLPSMVVAAALVVLVRRFRKVTALSDACTSTDRANWHWEANFGGRLWCWRRDCRGMERRGRG